jgi:hypothetical protein
MKTVKNPAEAAKRMSSEVGPLWKLTNKIAEAIYQDRHYPNGDDWEYVKANDPWLAVGSWQTAEAIMAILPFKIEIVP